MHRKHSSIFILSVLIYQLLLPTIPIYVALHAVLPASHIQGTAAVPPAFTVASLLRAPEEELTTWELFVDL